LTSSISTAKPDKDLQPEWVRPRDALKVFPGGLTKLYQMMNEGRVESRKVDGMRLVNLESAANPK
jgi:hypothetical protein